MMTPRFASLVLAAGLACTAAPAAHAQAMEPGAPPEAFGEYSYYDAYPKRDPDNLVDISQWKTCWAFVEAESDRLDALSDAVDDAALEEELKLASIHYQIAEIYYNELIRGTAIHEGEQSAKTNESMEIEKQGLIGAGEQWLASNAADCITRMPDRDMPDFGELYPWLADGFGTNYRN